MNIPSMMKIKINTLTIRANNVFTEEQYNFLSALMYIVEQFDKIDKNKNVLCVNLHNGGFLVIEHNSDFNLNPLSFVDANGNILFDVNISVFDNQIKEFNKYVEYEDSKKQRMSWPYRKKVIAAIKDYKNDILDFCIHENLVPEKLIIDAREKYDSLPNDDYGLE